ncbi:hypothetical protein [Photorhabdus viridis]|uniref:hypothetical protein n=1 Tax=Photorhabdus viridis TaxID=3163327 RepID=UPI003307809C
MSRDNLLYQIYYSYQLHMMFSVLLGRIDKTLSFFLLLLGSSVIGNLGNQVIIGIAIAAITALRMAFSFEKTAESARKQSIRYLNLFTTQTFITSDQELSNQVSNIQNDDLSVWGSLSHPVDIITRKHLGEPVDIKLTRWEKFMSCIAR